MSKSLEITVTLTRIETQSILKAAELGRKQLEYYFPATHELSMRAERKLQEKLDVARGRKED